MSLEFYVVCVSAWHAFVFEGVCLSIEFVCFNSLTCACLFDA